MSDAFLLSRVLLQFAPQSAAIGGNLSAVTATPDGKLWLAGDELNLVNDQAINTIECLSAEQAYVYSQHQAMPLRHWIDLADEQGEIDIEGMDYDGTHLWLTGSHGTKRKKPKFKDADRDLEKLATVTADPNRYLIARIPLQPGGQSAVLRRTTTGNQLTAALRDDRHLGSFVDQSLPSKENGFDIEGLAVRGDRLFLGLRGPVLRGWAIVLELKLTEGQPGELQLCPIGSGDKLYRKHFLQLDGLGVRDLCFHGDDLLILAGATMDLVGATRLFRLSHPWKGKSDRIYEQDDQLQPLFDLPYVAQGDKAEGMTLFPCLGQSDSLLVVYDSPHPQRQVSETALFADVFRL